LAWNAFRTFGPLLQFDPHALPKGEDPAHGVWYGASTPDAALGEAFQVDRTIDRELDRRYLTGLSVVRPLVVLGLAVDSQGAWATRAGGAFAISTGSHGVTQHWARNIVEAFPDLDGLRYNSRFAGAPTDQLIRWLCPWFNASGPMRRRVDDGANWPRPLKAMLDNVIRSSRGPRRRMRKAISWITAVIHEQLPTFHQMNHCPE
jgi:hypothetical protein